MSEGVRGIRILYYYDSDNRNNGWLSSITTEE